MSSTLKFTRIAAKARGLTPRAHHVLRVLAERADAKGRSFAKQETLAEDMGYSERTVRRALAELEGCGWIVREHRQRRDGSRTSDLITVQDLATAARHAEAALMLPLMRVLAGGGQVGAQHVDNSQSNRTTCPVGQPDNMAGLESPTYTDESNLPLRGGEAARAMRGAASPLDKGEGKARGLSEDSASSDPPPLKRQA